MYYDTLPCDSVYNETTFPSRALLFWSTEKGLKMCITTGGIQTSQKIDMSIMNLLGIVVC